MTPMSKPRSTLPGLKNSRTFWKRCCCAYGFYPLLVAPVVTLAFLISLYSSSGCQFIETDVGFTPSNRAWNESDLEVGLFFQYRPDLPDRRNEYWNNFHASCHPYSTDFEEDFINADQTWKAARIMSHIASISGLLASVIAWAIVAFPLPSGCLWPGLLLPSVILAFIGEGSKFLFLDIALCRRPIWFPTVPESIPTVAETCALGWSAYASILAGALQGVGLLMVCCKTPRKRRLLDAPNHTTEAEPDVEEPVQIRTSFDENNSPFVIQGIAPDHETRQLSVDEKWEADETSREGDSVADFDVETNANPSQDILQKIVVSESRLSVKSKMENEVFASQSKGDEGVNELISDLAASLFSNLYSSTKQETVVNE